MADRFEVMADHFEVMADRNSADHSRFPYNCAPARPTDGACDEAAGADNDLWCLDEVGLSNGEERFDKGLDEGFDEGSCDEGRRWWH